MSFSGRLKHAWNAFNLTDSNYEIPYADTVSYTTSRPGRLTYRYTGDKSIISSIYTQISLDVSGVGLRHVRLDDRDRYLGDMPSQLNTCLTLKPNLDQGARQFRQDVVMTLFAEGVIAIVPVDTTINPELSTGFDIQTMRVGKIVGWRPKHVRVDVYDENSGTRKKFWIEKTAVAIVENPFYEVMNEPNSTLQRLLRKLSLLDAVDEQSGSGKLDLIIQLPYVIKSDARREQAEKRRKDIEFQLKDSRYGIAYTDGTEKITQLNRPAENNLLNQIQYLTTMLYGQLGLTEDIMNGTADEKTMLNYQNRTIVPLLDAIVEAMNWAFLSKTARSQKQAIVYFVDPFKLVPISNLADIADKFARNEILTSNEIRQIIGRAPSSDPKADKLQNSNMPAPSGSETSQPMEGASQNGT